jgi:hypothetical protein
MSKFDIRQASQYKRTAKAQQLVNKELVMIYLLAAGFELKLVLLCVESLCLLHVCGGHSETHLGQGK